MSALIADWLMDESYCKYPGTQERCLVTAVSHIVQVALKVIDIVSAFKKKGNPPPPVFTWLFLYFPLFFSPALFIYIEPPNLLLQS